MGMGRPERHGSCGAAPASSGGPAGGLGIRASARLEPKPRSPKGWAVGVKGYELLARQLEEEQVTTGFFLMGELVEFGPTEDLFERPKDKRTDDYIRGRFG